jgi:hypothetical protein
MGCPWRAFACKLCQRPVRICRSCDRGQRYCSRECSREASLRSHRVANKRYYDKPEGRQGNARRQHDYYDARHKKNLTDRGSPPPSPPPRIAKAAFEKASVPWRAPAWLLSSSPRQPAAGWRCHFCGRLLL